MTSTLHRWLEARDADAVREAWSALDPRVHVVTERRCSLDAYSAAQLAAAMLGERPEWIVDLTYARPAFEIERDVDACFLDHVWNLAGRCREAWTLHERRDGDRGVQVVTVSRGSSEPSPERASATVVRVFDRDRAASVHLFANTVATIGEVDLAPLDLHLSSQSFTLDTAYDLATVRGLVAQLAAELDAHYDTSTLWPGVVAETVHDEPAFSKSIEHAFTNGGHALAVCEEIRGAKQIATATVRGLPWGHKVEMEIEGRGNRLYGYIVVRLPETDIARLIARLGAIATLR